MCRVPGLRLIVQHKDMACWYASARDGDSVEAEATPGGTAGPPRSLTGQGSDQLGGEQRRNHQPQVIRLAHPASAVPNTRAHPGSPEEVWTPLDQRAEAHRRHRSVDEVTGDLLIYDPWPPGLGKIEWRKFKWYVGDTAPDSMDTSSDVQATILYHP